MILQGKDFVAFFSGGFLESVESPTTPTTSSTTTKLDRKMLPKVLSVIDKYGKTAIFGMYPVAEYDPTKGENITGDIVEYPKKIIPPFEFETKYIDGDLIKVGDMQSGVAAQDIEFTPVQGMTVSFDSMIWKIVRAKPIYSGQQIALYMFQLRK